MTPDGEYVGHIGVAESRKLRPAGVAVDQKGNILVLDAADPNRVLVFGKDDRYAFHVAEMEIRHRIAEVSGLCINQHGTIALAYPTLRQVTIMEFDKPNKPGHDKIDKPAPQSQVRAKLLEKITKLQADVQDLKSELRALAES